MDMMQVVEMLNQGKILINEPSDDPLKTIGDITTLVSTAALGASEFFNQMKNLPKADDLPKVQVLEHEKEGEDHPPVDFTLDPNKVTPVKADVPFSVPSKEEFSNICSIFDNLQDGVSKIAEMPPQLIVAVQKEAGKYNGQIPATMQSVLAKLIKATTDKIIDSLIELDPSQ